MASQPTPPVPFNRLKQIANDACQSAIGGAEFYEHSKTEQWNSTIINSILKALVSESTPAPSGTSNPTYKFAVNSTIVQHLVPTSQLNKSRGTGGSDEEASVTTSTDGEKSGATGTDGKPHVGRRGMHSATGAYWNEKTDGMWTYKYEGGEDKGMDIVIMLLWVGL